MVVPCEKSRFFDNYKNQLFATLTVNILTFVHGNTLGWLAPTLLILQSDNSPLESGKVTVEEASWIGSIIFVSGFFGIVSSGILIDRIGRKNTLYLLTLPHICFWLILIFGVKVTDLYIARILSGFTGGGIFLVIPTFIADISDNKIRGTLGSSFTLFLNFGILSAFILTSNLSYSLFPRILIGLPILFIISIYFLPDTPQYLINRNQLDQAESSLKFYRNFKGTTKEEVDEFNEYFNNLKTTVRGNVNSKSIEKLSFKDFRQPQAVKGLFIGVLLMMLHQFSGLYALIFYTSNIFKLSGSAMDPNTCTIIVGAIQLLGTLVATNFVDRIGRKILLILSAIGVAIGLFVLGLFSFLSQSHDVSHFSWIAVTSMSIAIFLGSLGLLSLPFVILSEILPQRVKSAGIMFCTSTLSGFAFVAIKVFPIMMMNLGISGVMWICAGISTIGAILIFIFLSETKGKCLEKSDEKI